jgi:TPR repeat protein
VKSPWKQLVPLLFSALALVPAIAQTPAPQTVSVDPALVAKANAGDAASQVLVAESYAAGKGVARDSKQLAADYKQAAAWYREAADQGHAGAQIHLAELYRDGRGVARDMAQAAAWYRKAAELGDAGAQGTLGMLYSMGQGVPHDDVEAYYWFDLAAAVKGPRQEQYAANRQNIGARISADELAQVQERVATWLAEHPRAGSTE